MLNSSHNARNSACRVCVNLRENAAERIDALSVKFVIIIVYMVVFDCVFDVCIRVCDTAANV